MSRTAKRALLALACLAAIAPAILLVSGALPYRVYVVRTGSMSPTIPSRSAVIVRQGVYHLGQVISYRTPNGVVTHRLVETLPDGRLQTKGDANRTEDPYTVRPSNVIGGVVAAPRKLGYWLVYFKNPAGLASLFLSVILLGLVYSLPSDLARRKQARQVQSTGETAPVLRGVHAPPASGTLGPPSMPDAGARPLGLQSAPSRPASRQMSAHAAPTPTPRAAVAQTPAHPGVVPPSAIAPHAEAAPASPAVPSASAAPVSAAYASAACETSAPSVSVPQQTPSPARSAAPGQALAHPGVVVPTPRAEATQASPGVPPTSAAPATPAPAAPRPAAPAPAAPVRPVRTREEQLSAALATFMRVSCDVEAAALVSLDGFTMASVLPVGMHEDRVGAMSAAILGLGERASLELGRGTLSQVIVGSDTGYVLLMAAGDRAVLTALARLEAKLGLLLCDMRDAVEAIAEILG